MPTRNVVITDAQDRMIADLVENGRYQNASEVLRAGLRLLQQDEQRHAAELARLREAVAVGIRDIERGDFREFASFEELDAYLRQLTDEVLGEPEATAR